MATASACVNLRDATLVQAQMRGDIMLIPALPEQAPDFTYRFIGQFCPLGAIRSLVRHGCTFHAIDRVDGCSACVENIPTSDGVYPLLLPAKELAGVAPTKPPVSYHRGLRLFEAIKIDDSVTQTASRVGIG